MKSLATWEALFGGAEAIMRGEDAFIASAREATTKEPVGLALPPGQLEAVIGIEWEDPTTPIFYDLVINHVPVGKPSSSRRSPVVRPVTLRRGQPNRVHWAVQHMAQGWKHRVYLKFDDKVMELDTAQDPSKDSKKDDLRSGTMLVTP